MGRLLVWMTLLSLWWGVCRYLGMNVYGFVLTTAWLVTVAVVRTAVSEMAALAISVVLGLIAEVVVVFVPAVTTEPGDYALFVSLTWTWLGFFFWLGIACLLGCVAWQAVRVAFDVGGWAEKLMQTKRDD